MQKIIFFDIDGTIWDEQMQIPDSTVEAFKKLRANGHKTFLCSGRGRSNISSKRLFDLGFDGIIASCGNHIEMDGQILYEKIFSKELTQKVIRILEENGMPAVLEGPDYHWIDDGTFENDPYVDYLRNKLKGIVFPIKGNEDNIRMNKFSADILPETDFDTIQKELNDEIDFIVHPGDMQIVEAVPKGSSKATGIMHLCEILGVDIKDTYAIGDSVNDLDMIACVGHGIAMGNGVDEVKQIADFITKPINEDGLYFAMEHYGLI